MHVFTDSFRWPKARPGSTEASFAEKQVMSGRLICDTYLNAKDMVKARSYSLQTLTETILNLPRQDLDYDRIRDHWAKAESIVHLLQHAERDAYFQAMLSFQLQVLPLTKQLTCIAGNLWNRTLIGGRAERNEFLLLHEFHNAKFICPDKSFAESSKAVAIAMAEDDQGEEGNAPSTLKTSGSRRKPTYAGGLVLEPKKGFYDSIVLLLDFNSLYPSIIQEYNICFTTVERDYSTPEAAERMPPLPDPTLEQGILPRILASLVSRRRQIKSMMKDPKLTPGGLAQLEIRQKALKLTANSMYGCLGFAHSRFFAKPLAMLITGKGRSILQSTVDLAMQECKLDVIYGDTDSVMIHTGTRILSEARKMGSLLKKAVNERYRLLEIELDGIFEKLLLLKKKKYAAVVMEELPDGSIKRKREMKGLDLVRRDWCALSVETSEAVLERLLAASEADSQVDVVEGVHSILTRVAESVSQGTVPLDKYIITKNLTKEPEAYADAKSQPHVQVALQMRAKGTAVKSGDTIPYVICRETASGNPSSNNGGLADHAFHPDQVRKDHLRVDTEWYLAQQVHPCVSRLCEYLQGTDNARLASCLGLDSRKYISSSGVSGGHQGGEGTEVLSTLLSNEERYRNCQRVSLACVGCKMPFEFKGLVHSLGQDQVGLGLQCPTCKTMLPMTRLYYTLTQHIRNQINEYYAGWMQCDDATCRTRTRQIRVYPTRCPVETCRGTMRTLYPAQKLHLQLLYLRSLLDTDALKPLAANLTPDVNWRQIVNESECVRTLIKSHLDLCAYPIINLADIFSFVKIQ